MWWKRSIWDHREGLSLVPPSTSPIHNRSSVGLIPSLQSSNSLRQRHLQPETSINYSDSLQELQRVTARLILPPTPKAKEEASVACVAAYTRATKSPALPPRYLVSLNGPRQLHCFLVSMRAMQRSKSDSTSDYERLTKAYNAALEFSF